MMRQMQDDECGAGLAFREKRAWLYLAALIIVYGGFFATIARLPPAQQTVVQVMIFFAIAMVIFGVVMAVGTVLLTASNPAEARARPDERDSAIARRSTVGAYFVLMVEVWLMGVALPFVAAGWRITVAALLAMVVADGVRQLLIGAGYRLGWHG